MPEGMLSGTLEVGSVRLLVLIAFLAASASSLPAAEVARPHFVRTRATKQKPGGSFQTAAVRYHKADAPVDVILCAVVHLGEPRYFGRIQKLLSQSDRVLYEVVQIGNDDHPVPASARGFDPASMLANLLGLVHQATALDYEQANFVWADITFDELVDKGGQDLLQGLLSGGPSAAADIVAGSVASLLVGMMDAKLARAQLADVLAKAFDDLPALLGDQLTRPLIQMRNQRLMSVVDRELGKLPHGTLTILYGAGHMPDLDRTLQARGYQPVGTRWLSAWTY